MPEPVAPAAALAALKQAGVATKILTGDNELVSEKVCKEVGLPVGRGEFLSSRASLRGR